MNRVWKWMVGTVVLSAALVCVPGSNANAGWGISFGSGVPYGGPGYSMYSGYGYSPYSTPGYSAYYGGPGFYSGPSMSFGVQPYYSGYSGYRAYSGYGHHHHHCR